ncbi:MAG: signal recognition particle receptor subunit alpha, partial [Verrucomicrobiota bacterium]
MAGWLKGVLGRITGSHEAVDWDEVEAALWQSDLGAPTATAILEKLRSKGLALHSENVLETAREEAAKFLPEKGQDLVPMPDGVEGPVVILMVGVNGTGKTTSSAKLAALLKGRGHS